MLNCLIKILTYFYYTREQQNLIHLLFNLKYLHLLIEFCCFAQYQVKIGSSFFNFDLRQICLKLHDLTID